MRALVTGSSGFTGRHLCSYLLEQGATVYGVDRRLSNDTLGFNEGGLKLSVGDLLDEVFLRDTLRESKPSHVFHLAGVVGHSVDTGVLYRENMLATNQLLSGLYSLGQTPRVVVVSSSAVYGYPTTLPIKETHNFRPYNDYAVSKIAQEMVSLQYYLCYKMPIMRVRTFNLIGPGLSQDLMPSALARQVAIAELRASGVLHVGNLTPKRDFVDVRDAVRAYVLLATSGHPGEVYNVCSGTSHSVRECAQLLVSMSRVPIDIETEESRRRAVEVDNQVGSYDRLHALSGWRPMIPFETSWHDLLDDWRVRMTGEEGKS